MATVKRRHGHLLIGSVQKTNLWRVTGMDIDYANRCVFTTVPVRLTNARRGLSCCPVWLLYELHAQLPRRSRHQSEAAFADADQAQRGPKAAVRPRCCHRLSPP